MKSSEVHPSDWWSSHRKQYNLGLIVSGILAFIAYVVVGSAFLPAKADFEITIFTTIFQGIGYMIMMGIANVLYFIGPISERCISPSNPDSFRLVCFRLGFWISVALPFSIPVLLLVSFILHPD